MVSLHGGCYQPLLRFWQGNLLIVLVMSNGWPVPWLSVCGLGVVSAVRVGTSVSLNRPCRVCTRETACFHPGPVDGENSNALFYRAFESPPW